MQSDGNGPHQGGSKPVLEPEQFGARGDGFTNDTAAIQHAIDAAAALACGAQVRLGDQRRYLVGALHLHGNIDFHLAGNARLVLSTDPQDYLSSSASALVAAGVGSNAAALYAHGADNLTISGTGTIDGCVDAFMERFDEQGEWWIPKAFRPRLLVLEHCAGLTIRDVTLADSPCWTLHLLGCRQVLIEGVRIRNRLDVPNCDGIALDHCQHVLVRHCHISSGDDAIVIKTTAGHDHYGPTRDVHVHDCVLETQDAGLKIGSETHQDIHDVLFERCRIVRSGRGLCIQLRDAGIVHHVTFRDIRLDARHFAAPWWGHGEAISFTCIPRDANTLVGLIRDIRVADVIASAENSIRVDGLAGGRLHTIQFERVSLLLSRTTRYPGGIFDNRPTQMAPELERRSVPGVSVRHADHVSFGSCAIRWQQPAPAEFTHLLVTEDAPELEDSGLMGEAAQPMLQARLRHHTNQP